MSTLKVDTLTTTDATNTIATERVANGTAAAWVNFNGTGTVAIRAAYNVSSITDNGTGAYQINFTNSMLDTNYAVEMTIQFESGTASSVAGMCGKDGGVTPTTTYFGAGSWTKDSSSRADTNYAYVVIYR